MLLRQLPQLWSTSVAQLQAAAFSVDLLQLQLLLVLHQLLDRHQQAVLKASRSWPLGIHSHRQVLQPLWAQTSLSVHNSPMLLQQQASPRLLQELSSKPLLRPQLPLQLLVHLPLDLCVRLQPLRLSLPVMALVLLLLVAPHPHHPSLLVAVNQQASLVLHPLPLSLLALLHSSSSKQAVHP